MIFVLLFRIFMTVLMWQQSVRTAMVWNVCPDSIVICIRRPRMWLKKETISMLGRQLQLIPIKSHGFSAMFRFACS